MTPTAGKGKGKAKSSAPPRSTTTKSGISKSKGKGKSRGRGRGKSQAKSPTPPQSASTVPSDSRPEGEGQGEDEDGDRGEGEGGGERQVGGEAGEDNVSAQWATKYPRLSTEELREVTSKMGKVPHKNRYLTAENYERKFAKLQKENDDLKHWWAINMQDRPEIKYHNPDDVWRTSQKWWLEGRRNRLAFDEAGEMQYYVDNTDEEWHRLEGERKAWKAQLEEVTILRDRALADVEDLTERLTRKRELASSLRTVLEQSRENCDNLSEELVKEKKQAREARQELQQIREEQFENLDPAKNRPLRSVPR